MDVLNTLYPWVKVVHLIAVISWMAGLLYLPRLYVYHVETKSVHLNAKETIIKWEYLLLKLVSIILMSGFHGFLIKQNKLLEKGIFQYSGKQHRFLNEVPTVLMIIIITMVIVRPF